MVGSGSALTYHLTDRIETGRPFVKLVQLAKEEEDGKKNLSLPSKENRDRGYTERNRKGEKTNVQDRCHRN